MTSLRDALRDADRNVLALVLSVVPGLGHLFKQHFAWGLVILVAGNALMVFIAAWLSLATLGLSLIVVPILWFVCIGWSAYLLPDRRTHHTTPTIDLDESGHFRHHEDE